MFAPSITAPRPKRSTSSGATSDPARAPSPMPAVTNPIAIGCTRISSRKYRIVGACANENAQPTTEVKITIARR